jgi:diketogulonate reductase-like aldo/keto reductase
MTMLHTAMRFTQLPSGESVPVLGQGTWHMGEDSGRRDEEIAALRLGLDLGMTLIDTAEMYGDGAAEATGRRSDRRAARRGFSRQQGAAESRVSRSGGQFLRRESPTS